MRPPPIPTEQHPCCAPPQEIEDVCPNAATQTETLRPELEIDEIGAVRAYHDGDARAAIETLLDDVRHLRQQLALAEGAMSRGMTRGWSPRYERDDA